MVWYIVIVKYFNIYRRESKIKTTVCVFSDFVSIAFIIKHPNRVVADPFYGRYVSFIYYEMSQ